MTGNLFETGVTVTAGPTKEPEKPPRNIEPALLPEWVRRALLAHVKTIENREAGDKAEAAYRDAYRVFQMIRNEFAASDERLKPQFQKWWERLLNIGSPKNEDDLKAEQLLEPFLKNGYISKSIFKHSLYIDLARDDLRAADRALTDGSAETDTARERARARISDPLNASRLFYFVVDFAVAVHRKLPGVE